MNYSIININENKKLVIVLSRVHTQDYWADLLYDLQQSPTDVVYFDFLCRNGLERRYFMSRYNPLTQSIEELKSCHVDIEVEFASRDFYRQHKKYIELSNLSISQKTLFLMTL